MNFGSKAKSIVGCARHDEKEGGLTRNQTEGWITLIRKGNRSRTSGKGRRGSVTDQMIGPDDPTKDKTTGARVANHLWLDWLACETVETKSTLVGTTNQSIDWLDWLALETVETSSI